MSDPSFKIVVRRHASEYHILRALAVAQAGAAAAGPAPEVFLECFDRYKKLLNLCPSMKWKNPHHPFAVSERGNAADPKSFRAGGTLYDEVLDFENEGPIDPEWLASGAPWWRYMTARVKQGSDFGAKLKIASFPTLEVVDDPYAGNPPDYVVIAPLSNIADMRQVNANAIENFAKAQFPGSAIAYVSPENTFLGETRNLMRYNGFTSLAGILRSARAVIAVNGFVSALAQSLFKGERLVKRYYHVKGIYAAASKDIFLKQAALLETETDRNAGEPTCGILAIETAGPAKGAVKVLQTAAD
jgi:hypothetical protein